MKKARRRVNGKKVLVFLVLGLVINIGVALAIARWGSDPSWNSDRLEWETSVPERWPGPVPETCGATIAEEQAKSSGDRSAKIFPRAFIVHSPGWSAQTIYVGSIGRGMTYKVHRIGFPLGSLRYDDKEWIGLGERISFDDVKPPSFYGGWSVYPSSPWVYPSYILPLVPVWSGLIINTLVYAGVLWGLVWLIAFVRARRRVARGLCAKCAYDVTGLLVCPECGRAVPSNRATRAAG